MYARNLEGRTGKPVVNQIEVSANSIKSFFSYGTLIAEYCGETNTLTLDETYYNYSVTTSKYLNQWFRNIGQCKEGAVYGDLQ